MPALRDVATPALKTPRAAAIAGIIFSISMITAFGIIRLATLDSGASPGPWLSSQSRRKAVEVALDLTPFAGIAFLWFLGVIRNQLGQREDKFFATVLFGSGLLFVAALFGSSAVLSASLEAIPQETVGLPANGLLSFGLRLGGFLMNIFGVKMAAMFMFSTCTLALRTAFLPRWVSYSGFGCGVILLAIITDWPWIELVFPLWTLSVSCRILASDLLGRKAELG